MSLQLYESIQIKTAMLEAGVRDDTEHRIFKNGLHSDIKLDAPKITNNPRTLILVQRAVKRVARSKGRVIVPVPDGMSKIMTERNITDGISIQAPKKVEDYKFIFTPQQENLLRKLNTLSIAEDIVSTGSTPAALAETVHEINPELQISLVGIWLRGHVWPEYAAQFSSMEFLVEEYIQDWQADECPNPACQTLNI